MKRRWPILAGLLAGGAAVGAAGAMLLRRRRKQWEGYEPDEDLDLVGGELGAAGDQLTPEAAAPGKSPETDNNQAVDAARSVTGGD